MNIVNKSQHRVQRDQVPWANLSRSLTAFAKFNREANFLPQRPYPAMKDLLVTQRSCRGSLPIWLLLHSFSTICAFDDALPSYGSRRGFVSYNL